MDFEKIEQLFDAIIDKPLRALIIVAIGFAMIYAVAYVQQAAKNNAAWSPSIVIPENSDGGALEENGSLPDQPNEDAGRSAGKGAASLGAPTSSIEKKVISTTPTETGHLNVEPDGECIGFRTKEECEGGRRALTILRNLEVKR